MVTIVVTDVIPVLPVFFLFSIMWNENYFLSSEIEQKNFANGLGFRVFKAFNLPDPRQEEKIEERTRKTKH